MSRDAWIEEELAGSHFVSIAALESHQVYRSLHRCGLEHSAFVSCDGPQHIMRSHSAW